MYEIQIWCEKTQRQSILQKKTNGNYLKKCVEVRNLKIVINKYYKKITKLKFKAVDWNMVNICLVI